MQACGLGKYPVPLPGVGKTMGENPTPGKAPQRKLSEQGGVLSARARGEREHGRERLTAKRDELRTQGRKYAGSHRESRTSSKGSIQERAADERCWQCEAGLVPQMTDF